MSRSVLVFLHKMRQFYVNMRGVSCQIISWEHIMKIKRWIHNLRELRIVISDMVLDGMTSASAIMSKSMSNNTLGCELKLGESHFMGITDPYMR